MVSNWVLSRSVERLGALDEKGLESHAYRAAACREISGILGYDAWVWPMADPLTAVGIAPMAVSPCGHELPLMITLKYGTTVNRWTVLPTNPAQAVSLQAATGGEPSRSRLWAGLLCRYGITDVLSVVFADRWGFWGWLDLWREQASGNFTQVEAQRLSALAPVITLGLRHCAARQFTLNGTTDGMSGTLHHEQAVLILDGTLSVISQTASTDPWLDLLQPGPPPYGGIPAEVLNVAAQLLAHEGGIDSHPAHSLVHVGAGVWARLSANGMHVPAGSAAASIAVTIQDALPSERLEVFKRCFALTPSESLLLELLSTGLDTAALASRLAISTYTVQDKFKSLFAKCGVQSRAMLLALAIGH